jgi:hypothetical protein
MLPAGSTAQFQRAPATAQGSCRPEQGPGSGRFGELRRSIEESDRILLLFLLLWELCRAAESDCRPQGTVLVSARFRIARLAVNNLRRRNRMDGRKGSESPGLARAGAWHCYRPVWRTITVSLYLSIFVIVTRLKSSGQSVMDAANLEYAEPPDPASDLSRHQIRCGQFC